MEGQCDAVVERRMDVGVEEGYVAEGDFRGRIVG
jgi:hypothetical protein